jgi:hypothetical protein
MSDGEGRLTAIMTRPVAMRRFQALAGSRHFGPSLVRGSFVRYPPRPAESDFQSTEDRLMRDAQRRADLPQR